MELYFLLSLTSYLWYLGIKGRKALHMLQQNWYNLDMRYLKWMLQNKRKVIVLPELFILLFLFLPSIKWLPILFFLFYAVLGYLTIKKEKKEQKKLPLAYTKRIMRLIVTNLVLLLIVLLPMVLYFQMNLLKWNYLLLGFYVLFEYGVVMLSNIINIPIEKMVFYHYKRCATKKLASLSHMKVIGITGSYGKTSSKQILNEILNMKYVATPTPKNFNTTYGLINAINNYLDKFNDYWIAEMGAFKEGEIKELCDLVHPTYGILTTIGTAHLESFGSRENIQKGKFELIESLPVNGIGILNMDDPYQVSYPLQNDCEIDWIGIDNKKADLYATNIKVTGSGTSFDCIWKGDKTKYHFETSLLGKHNIYNILAAVMLGYRLGIEIPLLQLAVKRLVPVEHRLELKQYGTLTIIDDAYNSNPVGSKNALEVLHMMKGLRIAVTPGMIELGKEQYERNFELGESLAVSADHVILVGKEQTKPIYEGLKKKKMKEENIHILNDIKEAFPLIQSLRGEKDTYVLLENDLPDMFNE